MEHSKEHSHVTTAKVVTFGSAVATLEDKIVMTGGKDSMLKLFVYTIDGQLLKELELFYEFEISDVAMSDEVMVLTGRDDNTIVYSNLEPDFPQIVEIEQKGTSVAVSGNRIVIGHYWANIYDSAWLHNTNCVLIKELEYDVDDISFGFYDAITNDHVVVAAPDDGDDHTDSGSVLIYSAITVQASDGESYDSFGSSLFATDSYFVVGSDGDDDSGIYPSFLFNFEFTTLT